MKISDIITEKATITQGIKDQAELSYLQKALDIISGELGLGSEKIVVSFDPSPIPFGKSQYGLTIPFKGKGIVVYVDRNLSTGDKLLYMAHEMVHAEQIARGDLDLNIDFKSGTGEMFWKGKKVNPEAYSKSADWETEAYTKQRELRDLVLSQIGNFTR